MTKLLFGVVSILAAANIAAAWWLIYQIGLAPFWIMYTIIYM